MVTVSKIGSREGLMELEPAWNSLLERCASRSVFLTFEWVYLWWKYFGEGRELYVLVAKEGKEIVGIAPLMLSSIKKMGIKARKLEFIGMPLSDYSDLIIPAAEEKAKNNSKRDMEIVQAFLDFLRAHRQEWDIISLNRVQEDSSTLSMMRKAKKPTRLFGASPCDISPRLIRGVGERGAKAKEEDREREQRKSLGKSATRLLRDGGGRLVSCSKTGADPLELMETLFRQHIERWDKTSTPSMFRVEEYRNFFSELVPGLMKKGDVDIIYLPFKEKPAAFLLAFTYNGSFMLYMITNDSGISKYSPGRVILKLSIDSELSRRYGVYDFMRGAHGYKMRYANHLTRSYRIIVHRNILLFMLDSAMGFFEFRIKQDERLLNFFLRFEKWLRVF